MWIEKRKTRDEIKTEIAAATGIPKDMVEVEFSPDGIRVFKRRPSPTEPEGTFTQEEETAITNAAATFNKYKKGNK